MTQGWADTWEPLLGFPGGSVVKNLPANAGDASSNPWVGKIPWRRKWQPTPIFLPGESHGQRSLVGYSPWGMQSPTCLGNWAQHAQKRLRGRWAPQQLLKAGAGLTQPVLFSRSKGSIWRILACYPPIHTTEGVLMTFLITQEHKGWLWTNEPCLVKSLIAHHFLICHPNEVQRVSGEHITLQVTHCYTPTQHRW